MAAVYQQTLKLNYPTRLIRVLHLEVILTVWGWCCLHTGPARRDLPPCVPWQTHQSDTLLGNGVHQRWPCLRGLLGTRTTPKWITQQQKQLLSRDVRGSTVYIAYTKGYHCQTVKKRATYVNQLSGGVHTLNITSLVQGILAVMVVLHDTTDKDDYTLV